MDIPNLENLSNNGSILFQDSETFLNDLTENEINSVKGGVINTGTFLELIPSEFLNLLAIPGEQNAIASNDQTVNGQTFNARTASNINTSP
ncbi:hypothetical protein BV372_02605 [Nostoc sp. T09]|uniref:hypothetical protein n=1 Tax=Nostoc sp. T09 TaxID=1932621 RepID=UPI000A3AC25F|nr:hypothetical protein [Nostoc sp. T09]OUL37306.1 hypothetical protein BV372_02605 [Nostoc sp. T09]